MFSSKFLLALVFSVISVRASSHTCTYYLVPAEAIPADPTTSIDTAIDGALSVLMNSSEVTVTSTVTTGDGVYTALAAITVGDQPEENIISFSYQLPGSEIGDGTITYIVSEVDC